MGIFGGKKKDDDDDLEEGNGTPHVPPPMRQQPPSEPKVAATSKKPYGIDELVVLMRRLPSDNIELVVRVLKETLESVKIPVPGLIKDSEKREAELTNGINEHRKAITNLEEELAAKKKSIEESIAAKKKAISELEAQHKEVAQVKDRLTLGLKLDQVTVTPVTPVITGTKLPPPPPPPTEPKP